MDPLFYSENRLEILKGRATRCQCKYCGGKLEIRQIIFNSYEEARVEIFCADCNRIEYGVEPEIYEQARYFVDELRFGQTASGGEDEKAQRMQVAKVCDILAWGAKHWGILTDEGFTIVIASAEKLFPYGVILEDEDLL